MPTTKHARIPAQEWYTRTEAAAILRISKPTLDRMIRDGSIVSRRIGRLVYIPWYEVRAERKDEQQEAP